MLVGERSNTVAFLADALALRRSDGLDLVGPALAHLRLLDAALAEVAAAEVGCSAQDDGECRCPCPCHAGIGPG